VVNFRFSDARLVRGRERFVDDRIGLALCGAVPIFF
jgi:hypothetical protein